MVLPTTLRLRLPYLYDPEEEERVIQIDTIVKEDSVALLDFCIERVWGHSFPPRALRCDIISYAMRFECSAILEMGQEKKWKKVEVYHPKHP